jgi:uncharacterized protein (TIRG00374 family)
MAEPTTPQNRRRRILLTAVKIAVAAALLTLLLRGMRWSDFRAAFRGIRWWWFVLAAVLHFPGYVISAWRWGILLRAQGQHIPFWRLFESYLVATFFNYTLLGTLGGDFVRMYHTGLGQKRGAQAASAVLVERLTGLATMILLAALGMALLALWRGGAAEGTATMHVLVWGAATLFVLFCVGVSLLTHPRVVEWLAGLLDRPWPLVGAVRHALLKLHEALAVFRGNPRPVYVNLAWALLLQINVAAHYFCLGLAMGPAALVAAPLHHALSYIVLVPIVTLILMIPVTPGGVGIREWTLSRPVVRSGLGFPARAAGAANAVLLGWLQVASVLLYGGVGLVLFLARSLRLRGKGPARS